MDNSLPQNTSYYLEPEKESTTTKVVKNTGKTLFNILQVLAVIGMFLIILYLFALPVSIVDGPSMEPNFCNTDVYLTYKVGTYFSSTPYKRGDVVAFKLSENSNIIKRVIALEGETFKFEGGKVYINGELFNETYLPPTRYTDPSLGGQFSEGYEYTVPEGKYLVLGDNRPVSRDSRDFSFIEQNKNAINGNVVMVIWPPAGMRVFDNAAGFDEFECKAK